MDSDIEQLRSQDDSETVVSKQLDSQTTAMKDLNAELHKGSLRAQAKQIDLELRKLEAAQLLDELNLVKVLSGNNNNHYHHD